MKGIDALQTISKMDFPRLSIGLFQNGGRALDEFEQTPKGPHVINGRVPIGKVSHNALTPHLNFWTKG
jgi:ketopantoate reductase